MALVVQMLTKREILNNIVCAYIQGTGSFPKLSADGKFADPWYKTVDAIYNIEEDKGDKFYY